MPGCLAPGASTARAGQPGGGVLGGFGGACACVGRRRHPRCHARPCPQVQTFGEVRVGLCHGHQIVPPGDRAMAAALQRKLDVDVLILGDTHKFQAYRHEGRFVISPGSATGAFTPSLPKPTPSFVLMDVNGPRVRLGGGERERGVGRGRGCWGAWHVHGPAWVRRDGGVWRRTLPPVCLRGNAVGLGWAGPA